MSRRVSPAAALLVAQHRFTNITTCTATVTRQTLATAMLRLFSYSLIGSESYVYTTFSSTTRFRGLYHQGVINATTDGGWALISGPLTSPPDDAEDLPEWGRALVPSAAMLLLNTNEVHLVLGAQVAVGDELIAVIQESGIPGSESSLPTTSRSPRAPE